VISNLRCEQSRYRRVPVRWFACSECAHPEHPMTLLRPCAPDGATVPRSRSRHLADALVLGGIALLFWLLVRLPRGQRTIRSGLGISRVSPNPTNLPKRKQDAATVSDMVPITSKCPLECGLRDGERSHVFTSRWGLC
jgi:hypothetical protein